MAEQGVQEPALSRISPEDVFTERDRILGQIKNIYQNIEKTTHPMLIQQIEDEADFIVNMMVRLERLTGGKFRSDDTAVIQEICEKILADIYSLETHYPQISDNLYVELAQWIVREGVNVRGVLYPNNRTLNKILIQLQSVTSEFVIIGGMAIVMNFPKGGRTTRDIDIDLPSTASLHNLVSNLGAITGQTANVKFTDHALSLLYFTSAARTKQYTRGIDGRVLLPKIWEILNRHTIDIHGLRFASLDALAVLKTKALATRGNHQALKIAIDLEDVEACVLYMAGSGMTFDSELAIFCEEQHVMRLISIIVETFAHHRAGKLLHHMRETKFPHYKPSTSPRDTIAITSTFIVSCVILSLGAYYLYKGRR